jgi:DNA-binding transcriptional MerR regulator
MEQIHVFTTEKAAQVLGIPGQGWRIIKFANGKEYGITPSFASAEGSGSRRLYDLENVCQIGLALRLLEAGLRPKAIGKIIRQLCAKERISSRLEQPETFLAVFRTPQMGKPLDEKRHQLPQLLATRKEAYRLADKRPEDDLILVPLSSLFRDMASRLKDI